YFIRHTHYHNPDDIYAFHLPMYLSPQGRQHAVRVGRWFVEQQIGSLPIYASPIVRCVQTAEIIASATHASITLDKRLIETSLPNLQGKKKPDKTPWILEEEDPSRESRQSILARILDFYNEKIAKGNDCIAVSHGDALTILYYHLSHKPLPLYLWGPDNNDNVINRGEILKIELKGKTIHSLSRIKV
ncbi:histidine phosphatase family protein, partial [Candidatus Roizmanbacteria bacterium]|nr:histidine phosphatase family protein [Candidatus Roizmanbacteria bacterium]